MRRSTALALLAPAVLAAAGTGLVRAQDRVAEGRRLYITGCSSCHGLHGEGSRENVPSLLRSGEATVYYYLQTGRMPMADAEEQPRRKPRAYDQGEIAALVRYVTTLGQGPSLPDLDEHEGDIAEGGALYRTNCAPCHSAAGIGGALSYGRAAPSLRQSEPLVVAAAVRAGPGQMPVFGREQIDDEELASIARYVRSTQGPPNRGGAALGGAGPIPEGFVAWLFGIGTLLLAALWVGRREGERRR